MKLRFTNQTVKRGQLLEVEQRSPFIGNYGSEEDLPEPLEDAIFPEICQFATGYTWTNPHLPADRQVHSLPAAW